MLKDDMIKIIKHLDTRLKILYLKKHEYWYRSISGNLCDSNGNTSLSIKEIEKIPWKQIKEL